MCPQGRDLRAVHGHVDPVLQGDRGADQVATGAARSVDRQADWSIIEAGARTDRAETALLSTVAREFTAEYVKWRYTGGLLRLRCRRRGLEARVSDDDSARPVCRRGLFRVRQFRLPEIALNFELRRDPTSRSEAMMTTAISAAIMPYSIAVAPDSLRMNRCSS
jgi:hypothetical protein